MKSDLIITRFKTEPIIGTKESNDVKTFFGSKMIDIEDTIIIDNSKIQYSEYYKTGSTENNNGYQYYEDIDNLESIYLVDLSDVKFNNHTVSLVSQSTIDLKNNTQWNISIDWKNILREYIYYQLKNRRTFKCIKYSDVLSENINLFVRQYIENNLINRYQFSQLKLYVQYIDLNMGDEYNNPQLLFNPVYTIDVKSDVNLIKNANSTVFDELLLVNYKQTEPSTKMKFNYYFDLIMTKI
jgi:hypothetical protein